MQLIDLENKKQLQSNLSYRNAKTDYLAIDNQLQKSRSFKFIKKIQNVFKK